MGEVAVIYRVVLLPTGESYTGSYAHPTGLIPESGVGLPPGKRGGRNHGWWDKFSRGHDKSECRWERLEVLDAADKDYVRERRDWWIARDRQLNPTGNRNGPRSGNVAGFRCSQADRVTEHLKSRPASVDDLASELGITREDARRAISCIRARAEQVAKDGRRYFIRDAS